VVPKSFRLIWSIIVTWATNQLGDRRVGDKLRRLGEVGRIDDRPNNQWATAAT